jgi:hypothetical protein
MKTGLKKREKFLLFIAFAVGLISLTATYVITPMYNSFGDKQEQLEALMLEKMMLDLKIAGEQTYLQANMAAHEAYDEIARKYRLNMPNNEIDRIITDLCVRQNFNRPSLRFGASQEPYGYAFTVVPASLSLFGTYSGLLSLIDEVGRVDYLRLSHVGYVATKGDERRPPYTVTFEVTMMNPTVLPPSE